MVSKGLYSIVHLLSHVKLVLTGKPAVLEDDTNSDWVSSLKMGYEIPVSVSADSVSRYARAQARHKKKLRIEYAEETAVAVEPIASTCWFFQN